ncbi:MAG: 1-acyl-sn-glycerol-3-phosphate acyltransferase [Bacteroidales bacterium]|nr:1-acyl-sn-glycerol-3-phosphate acyltransferase [Bacteroidales bacterium]
MKKLWIAIVKLFGWKFDELDVEERKELFHSVLICAPHTSALDFLLGAAYLWNKDVNCIFFIKKELFVFPIRRFLLHFGAVPIDRGNRKNNMVETAVRQLQQNDRYTVVITPEGTRKLVKRWKRGFYEIAVAAQVPILVTYINYGTKHMGVGPTLMPTGDFDADMLKILEVYNTVKPRNAKGWDLEALKATYRAKVDNNNE